MRARLRPAPPLGAVRSLAPKAQSRPVAADIEGVEPARSTSTHPSGAGAIRARRAVSLIAALAATVGLAACGGGGGSTSATTTTEAAAPIPAECKAPPVTVDVEAKGDHPAGAADFEVQDAVARRVAILPGEMAFEPSALSGLESKASVTPLAAYVLHMADFRIARSSLTGSGLATMVPGEGKTVATLSLVPANEQGFIEGAVVQDGELGYESRSSLRPLQLTVFSDGDTTPQAYTDVTGEATILHLDEKSICVAFDVTFSNGGKDVYVGKGTVLAPVVRAADSFFFT